MWEIYKIIYTYTYMPIYTQLPTLTSELLNPLIAQLLLLSGKTT